MERLTRSDHMYECRMIGKECPAEKWLFYLFGSAYWEGDLCEKCPFEKIVNKLAEYEDQAEEMENDWR